MAPHIMLLLLLFAVSSSSLKYVYVPVYSYWDAAQKYCRTHYTDLAPVSSAYDMSLLQQAAEKGSNTQNRIWFGLMRNSTDWTKWMWSGGGAVTLTFWGNGEPSSIFNIVYVKGLLFNYMWEDAYKYYYTHFLCYKVHVVREMMAWEDALKFCRQNHQDLASVASETEMMLMRSELLKHIKTTEHVWVGLRFLGDAWMWVDKQPLVYKAWGANEQPWCPAMRCGALRVTGKLVEGLDVKTVNVGNVAEWNSRDCNEKLHFLCY